MPRPRDPDIVRIESDTYRRGYAREYKGQWVIFLGSRKIYTGLRPVPATIPKLKRRLDAEIEADLSGVIVAPLSPQVVPSLWEAADRWYDEHVEGNRECGAAHRATITSAIKAYKGDRDIPLGTGPGVTAALADRFSRIRREGNLSAGTTAQYLRHWKRIFTYAVAMGWLASNPIDLIRLPSRQRKPNDKRRYTSWELIRILWYVRHMRHGEERYRLLVWQLLTGMRIGETLDMRWSDVTITEDGSYAITVRGKGHKGQKRIRMVVIPRIDTHRDRQRWSQRLHAILREQQRISADRADPSRVWRWTNRTYVQYMVAKAKEHFGMESNDGRMVHTFRAMATHYMRHTLRFSRAYAAGICGHSESVQETTYDRDLDIREHERYLRERDISERESE